MQPPQIDRHQIALNRKAMVLGSLSKSDIRSPIHKDNVSKLTRLGFYRLVAPGFTEWPRSVRLSRDAQIDTLLTCGSCGRGRGGGRSNCELGGSYFGLLEGLRRSIFNFTRVGRGSLKLHCAYLGLRARSW